jgi:DNA primase
VIPASFLDEVRARTTLSGLVGRAIKLTRAGREHKGCCPFHHEKTPSFTVNDDKGFYHCFGCGAHGDAIRWAVDHDGLTFVEAVKSLAEAAGLAVPAPSAEAAAAAQVIAGQRPTLEAAAAIFAERLSDARHAAVRGWLDARGIGAQLAEEFGLGFAPEDGALAQRGFTKRDLIAVGLVGRTDAGFEYPRFRSRVMVPIHDAQGRITGFTARHVDLRNDGGGDSPGTGDPKKRAAKWVNSPDCAIFDKGATLFNLHRARTRFRAAGRLVIAEGAFDVVALHALGFAAVAPMGTALTVRQLERAWRLDPCPLLLFDGDAAGAKAAVRAAVTALPMLGPGRSLMVAALPGGCDPDDVAQRARAAGEDGALALGCLALAAQRAEAVLFDSVVAGLGHDAPAEDWAAAWAQLAEWGETIADADTQALTLRAWRRRWEVASGLGRANAQDAGAGPDGVLAAEVARAMVEAGMADPTLIDGGDANSATCGDERVQAMVAWLVDQFDAIAEVQDEIKLRMAVAKAMGFDPVMLKRAARMVIKDRDKPGARVAKEAIEAAYRRACLIEGPMTEAMLPPSFAVGRRHNSKTQAALPPPVRRIGAMIDAIEGMG